MRLSKWNEIGRAIQSGMNEQGEKLTIDGDLGPVSQRAMEKFDVAVRLKRMTEAPQAPVTSIGGSDADEGTVDWYRKAWALCEIDPGKEAYVRQIMKLIENGMGHYLKVATLLRARELQNFAYILGCIHFKEASCNFLGVLHNGEKIVGTGKLTTIVPKGRGPFATWEDAAVDAIKFEGGRWGKLLAGSDDIGDILYALERYNGTGYITGKGKLETSPYLWACSTINDGKGKYVSDGKYDENAGTDSTVGAALLLKQFNLAGKFQVS